MSLRDDLVAVLDPGNDDAAAHAQADAVLAILLAYSPGGLDHELTLVWRQRNP